MQFTKLLMIAGLAANAAAAPAPAEAAPDLVERATNATDADARPPPSNSNSNTNVNICIVSLTDPMYAM